jgi:hypothetical protein
MIAAARPRWLRYRCGPSNAREAINGDKKGGQRQDQGKAQEDLGHRGDYPQKNQRSEKKLANKAPSRRASPKKARPAANAAIKPTPVSPPARPVPATPTPTLPAQPAPPGERIGIVTHYYNHLSVATLRLDSGTLRIGDVIHIRGHTTDFSQRVEAAAANLSGALITTRHHSQTFATCALRAFALVRGAVSQRKSPDCSFGEAP